MSVVEVRQALGSWSLRLRRDTPREILDALTPLGHLAILPGRHYPATLGDNMLSAARYVGVLRGRDDAEGYELSGAGMAFWLGDENGKGAVIENALTFSVQTFSDTIRALLPTSVQEGTLHSVAGTYTGQHQWETPRKAITYVTDTFNAEWRVNGDGTLDAGTEDQLYVTSPKAVIVRRGAGRDPELTGISGSMSLGSDVEDYTTRVVLLANGVGSSVATGSADAVSVPYKDLFGNQVELTRLVSESQTSNANADARAQLALDKFSAKRQAVALTASDYDIKGSFAVGDYVYVFDPDSGFFDAANEIAYRGGFINPVKLRVVEMSWPVEAGWTVAFRNSEGTWFDLSEFYIAESGQSNIVVGQFDRSLSGIGGEPIGSRPNADTSVPDAPSLNTPFSTSSYQNGKGETKARIVVSWSQPLNTDGSAIQDGGFYEIRFKVSTEAVYQYQRVGFDVTSYNLLELTPGLIYDIYVRAVDVANNAGAWSGNGQTTASQDTIAPSTPAAPAVAGNALTIQVTHTLGKASGGTYNLESDLDHLEVHAGLSSGFTPSSATLVGNLPANASNLTLGIAAVGTFPVSDATEKFVKVLAVDRSGNTSAASDSASVTPTLIGTTQITDAAITSAKIQDLAVTNAKIANLSGDKIDANTITVDRLRSGILSNNLVPNGNFEDPDKSGWTFAVITPAATGSIQFGVAGTHPHSGRGRLEMGVSTGGVGRFESDPFPLTPSSEYTFSWWTGLGTAGDGIYVSLMTSEDGDTYTERTFTDFQNVNPSQLGATPTNWGRLQTDYTTTATENFGRIRVTFDPSAASSAFCFLDDIFFAQKGFGVAELSSSGLKLYDGEGELTINLMGSAGDTGNFVTIQNEGINLATIDSEGGMSAQTLTVQDSITVAGQDLMDEIIDALPKGIVGFGSSTSDVVGAGANTEKGYIEINFTAVAGRRYKVTCHGEAESASNGDRIIYGLRDGGMNQPDTSSTLLQRHPFPVPTSGANYMGHLEYVNTFTDGLHRLLWTFNGVAGNATMRGGEVPAKMYVEDMGLDLTDTAVLNDGGAGTVTPPQQYTTTFNATWSGTYDNSNNYEDQYDNEMKVGYYSGQSNWRSGVGFDYSAIQAAMSGATVIKAELFVYFHHWYWNDGGTAVIGTHNMSNATRPGTLSSTNTNRLQSSNWPRAAGRWVNLGTTIGNEFKAGTSKGIVLGPGPTTDDDFYGRADGVIDWANPPKLRFTYSK